VAPWQVHLNALKLGKSGVREAAESLYEALGASGVEVLYDDRDASAGVQFADADLLGIPIRLVVSERNLAGGAFEYKRRDMDESGTLPAPDAVQTVKTWIANALETLQSSAR
jgi:prolyl-tRNA synthetase